MFRFAITVFATTVGLVLAGGSWAWAQESSARRLFEAGKYDESVQAVAQGADAPPADVYQGAQSLLRLDRRDEAKAMLKSLDNGDGENPWTLIGRSATLVVDGDRKAALDTAARAVEIAPDSFHTQYQLGLVKILLEDFTGAATAFERATQIDNSDAYAHYYAGLASNKTRRIDRMASHFRAFVSLAPEAPERPQVESILRTLKK